MEYQKNNGTPHSKSENFFFSPQSELFLTASLKFYCILITNFIILFASSESLEISSTERLLFSEANETVSSSLQNYSRKFRYHSYSEIITGLEELEKQFPHLASYSTAAKLWPHLNWKASWFKCDDEKPCEIPIVRIAHKDYLTENTPEVFFSGCVHGDEVVGPEAAYELSLLLCKMYSVDPFITFMVNHRSIYIMPFANAYGFSHNTRKEANVDPNRDFPYLTEGKCFRSFTTRSINELFRDHLFRSGITWHGGTRSLTYLWGSFDGCYKDKKRMVSYEAPDNAMQVRIAEILQESAFKINRTSYFYPMGPTCDIIYPVNGGLIDFAYGGSWLSTPKPINTCKNIDYPLKNTLQDPSSFKCLLYLIETDYPKRPDPSMLGMFSELFNQSMNNGLVSRNIRMALKLIELAEPAVLFEKIPSKILLPGDSLYLKAYGVGCDQMTAINIELHKGICSAASKNSNGSITLLYVTKISPLHPCSSLAIWNHSFSSSKAKTELKNPLNIEWKPPFLLKHWGVQQSPFPNAPPRSHLARARLEKFYKSTSADGLHTIIGYKTWKFPVYTSGNITFNGFNFMFLNKNKISLPSLLFSSGNSSKFLFFTEGESSADTTVDPFLQQKMYFQNIPNADKFQLYAMEKNLSTCLNKDESSLSLLIQAYGNLFNYEFLPKLIENSIIDEMGSVKIVVERKFPETKSSCFFKTMEYFPISFIKGKILHIASLDSHLDNKTKNASIVASSIVGTNIFSLDESNCNVHKTLMCYHSPLYSLDNLEFSPPFGYIQIQRNLKNSKFNSNNETKQSFIQEGKLGFAWNITYEALSFRCSTECPYQNLTYFLSNLKEEVSTLMSIPSQSVFLSSRCGCNHGSTLTLSYGKQLFSCILGSPVTLPSLEKLDSQIESKMFTSLNISSISFQKRVHAPMKESAAQGYIFILSYSALLLGAYGSFFYIISRFLHILRRNTHPPYTDCVTEAS
ncbi:putative zinc carboxypeptidase [Cardiosporidium cionae]|uniref:Zinc carboxypeptidase n=1 Tax=Cardiosporidium cionae TaxID=476202 RepID=A0ABQ7JA02_9APIC|nr:putative zinc carboxypeptidase [Cardiosporidium cionae]|eukprot:KAF8820832.1 putative zinc carboxypeptidase [Cardiosporidium cionae]